MSSHQKNRMKYLSSSYEDNQLVSEFYFDSEHKMVLGLNDKEIEGDEEYQKNQIS